MENELGKIFKEERMYKRLSIVELAKLSGVDPKTISMIERGIRKKPNPETILKMHNILEPKISIVETLSMAGYKDKEICEIIDCKKYNYKFVIIVSGKGTVYDGNQELADAYVRTLLDDSLLMYDLDDDYEGMYFNHNPSVLIDYEEEKFE